MLEELPKDYLDKIELPEKIVKEIEEVVKEKKLNKEQRKILEENVKAEYMKAHFEPGEAIGIISAQSISEPATQMTMRTYHFAGTAGIRVTYGLPRLIELLDARKVMESPIMTIYLKKQFNNIEDAEKIAEKIIERKISDIIKRISLNLSENSIELECLDRKKIGVIINVIKKAFPNLKVKVRENKISLIPKDDLELKELQKLKTKILELHVSGIEKITNAVVRKENNEWIINTIGSNLEKVLELPEVDEKRTITSDIHETLKVLGVEAARNVLFNEICRTLDEQGLDVDRRHVMLVVDIMTFRGDIRPIGRYGVAGAKTSILARAAFEETVKHLIRAAIKKETDDLRGIFENVMIGKVIPSGTGMFDLLARLEKSEGK